MVDNNKQEKQIVFLILPTVKILDLADSVQAFDEAIELGSGYQLWYFAQRKNSAFQPRRCRLYTNDFTIQAHEGLKAA